MSFDPNHDQFVLRVKRGSEIDLALRALAEQGLTPEQIKQVSGYARTPARLRVFPDWFDNIQIGVPYGGKDDAAYELHYTEIFPNKVQIVTSDVNIKGQAEQAVAAGDPQLQLVWPYAPPYISVKENFDTPAWFEKMRNKVKRGRHIALEGPPGVGKDTAVEQLAAIEGKPLVTIGGDGGFRRRDLVGSPQIANGSSYFNVSEYIAAAVNGWWVLLTEVNAADPDALIYINSQLAAPYIVTLEGKAYPVHKDFRIFITYNHGLTGTKPLPQSFKDRFFSIQVPFFNMPQLRKRMIAMGMPEDMIPTWEAVVAFGVAMWDAHTSGRMRYQITTRRLADAVDSVLHDGDDIKKALADSVIAAIDSPVEQKAARDVLRQVCS